MKRAKQKRVQDINIRICRVCVNITYMCIYIYTHSFAVTVHHKSIFLYCTYVIFYVFSLCVQETSVRRRRGIVCPCSNPAWETWPISTSRKGTTAPLICSFILIFIVFLMVSAGRERINAPESETLNWNFIFSIWKDWKVMIQIQQLRFDLFQLEKIPVVKGTQLL